MNNYQREIEAIRRRHYAYRALIVFTAGVIAWAILASYGLAQQQPAPDIATLPAYSQNYVTAYGAPQPIWRTPIRTGLWRAIQPRGFYTPTYAVPVAPQNVQHFCPTCRQYHR